VCVVNVVSEAEVPNVVVDVVSVVKVVDVKVAQLLLSYELW